MGDAVEQKKMAPMPMSVSLEEQRDVEQAIYREARFLDCERYDDWVAMLADDLHYYMPGIETRYRRDKTDQIHDLNRMAYYNDNLDDIKKRLLRLKTGTAWSEDPATRYLHLVSNVEVEKADKPSEYRAYSNLLVYRNRNERDEDTLLASREDIWRREGERLKLVKRFILLKQNVLLSKNLNVYL